MLDYQFDIIGITETKIIKNIPPLYDTSINCYKHYSTPTVSTKGGTLIYMSMITRIVNQEKTLIQ